MTLSCRRRDTSSRLGIETNLTEWLTSMGFGSWRFEGRGQSRVMKLYRRKLSRLPAAIGTIRHRAPVLSIALASLLVFACVHDQKLAWEDTSQNENGFRIYRVVGEDKRLIGEVGPNITRFVDRGAPAGACYLVTAFNDEGESAPTRVVCGGG